MDWADTDQAGIDEAARSLERKLLGGPPRWDLAEFAARAGTDVEHARAFWRTMGFPNIDDEQAIRFTDGDVAALRRTTDLIRYELTDEETASSLTRALGHTMDRLVLWQAEALVDDAQRRQSTSDPQARLSALRMMPEVVAILESQLTYGYRRLLAAMVGRMLVDAGRSAQGRVDGPNGPAVTGPNGPAVTEPVPQGALVDGEHALPLARAVGFADLVSFTELTSQLGPEALAGFVHRFESIARDVVTSGGGRVVKTVGDEVLFVADDVVHGARIALGLVEAMRRDATVPQIRAGVVWGRVLSRFGDVFGPTVNLAARLTELAEPDQVLLDDVTASLCEATGEFDVDPIGPRLAHGLGTVYPVALRARRHRLEAGTNVERAC